MKLSVVTINYNNFEGLRRTAVSVIHQTFRDFEWIVIDGGSNDSSKEFIESLASNSEANLSFWCSEPDKGIFNGMNKGILKATGEYLIFMNSGDEFYENNTMEKAVSLMQSEYADVYYGDCVLDYGERKEMRTHHSPLDLYDLISLPLCHQAMFFNKKVFVSGLYDEKYRISCDCVKNVQLLLDGYSFMKLDMLVCLFDKHGVSSLSQEKNVNEFHSAIAEIVPKHILSLVFRLYTYEQGHTYVRIRNIEKKGGIRALILRFMLKIFG